MTVSSSSALPTQPDAVSAKLNPAYLALSRLRRCRYDECINTCTSILASCPLDRAVWTIKTQALTQQAYIDELDVEEDGIAEILLDENSISKTPRPGTSIKRSGTSSTGVDSSSSSVNASIRPMTHGGRPMSGFARPGTQSRGGGNTSNTTLDPDGAFKGNRPGTSRPMSVAGRYVRLGTQSLLSNNQSFINVEQINVQKIATRPTEAKALMEYLLTVEHNYRRALELGAECTKQSEYKDWYWKAQLGKCYYHLGLFREAEKQYKSILRNEEHTHTQQTQSTITSTGSSSNSSTTSSSSSHSHSHSHSHTSDSSQVLLVSTIIEMSKIYLKLDQPNTALDLFLSHISHSQFQYDVTLSVHLARLYEQLNRETDSLSLYKKILSLDNTHIESISCLAHYYFYHDQPEIALRYYRRLLHMSVSNTEIWQNIALCCFYAAQYDLCLSCFDRALALSDDSNIADTWYNIGQVAINIGDLNLAYQSFKIAISNDNTHAESFNNLGILELRKNNLEQASHFFHSAAQFAPYLFEPWFNGALVAFKQGDCQTSFELVQKALAAYPDHQESKELYKQLKKHFTML